MYDADLVLNTRGHSSLLLSPRRQLALRSVEMEALSISLLVTSADTGAKSVFPTEGSTARMIVYDSANHVNVIR